MLATLALVLATATGPLQSAPPCKYEDGSSQRVCVWDARHMGNGHGLSFVARHGGTDRATYRSITHKRAHSMIANWRASH